MPKTLSHRGYTIHHLTTEDGEAWEAQAVILGPGVDKPQGMRFRALSEGTAEEGVLRRAVALIAELVKVRRRRPTTAGSHQSGTRRIGSAVDRRSSSRKKRGAGG